jgi:tetratricopeptide (TPR) repeat protein
MSSISPPSMDDIFRQVGAGHLDAAEAMCRQALLVEPNDINVLGMLGAILLRKQQSDEAETLLLQAVELEPAFAKPYEDLGLLYLDRGDAERGLSHFEKALALDKSLVAAQRGVVVALQRLGRDEEADAIRVHFELSSPAVQALTRADGLRKNGDLVRAEKLCQEVIEREPENIAALRLMAVIASDDRRYVIAEGLLRRIVKLAPDKTAALSQLGRFLGERSRYPEAIEVLQQAIEIDATSVDFHVALGDMLSIVGRSAEALESYEHCLEQSPDNQAALNGRGHMLRIAGRQDEAQASYRRCAELNPNAGDAWWNLASLHGYRAADDEVAAMRAMLAGGNLKPVTEIAIHFALARACEHREDFAEAWQHYDLGNAGKRALVKYDPVETEILHDKLKTTFAADILQDKVGAPPTGKTPIFVLGMPRSGSTLIEQILASHSMVEGAGELPYVIMISTALGANHSDSLRYPEIIEELQAAEFTGLGRSYLHYAQTHLAEDCPYFTDKMPANFSHIGLIRLMLPHAKIIDARRNPLATCVANYRQLFAQGKNQSYDLMELAEYYLQYDEIMRHWNEVMPDQVLRVQYEDVVADLDGEVRRLLDFCELPFEEECINFHQSARPVNTASSEQVRQPIYDSAVNFWKNYELHLDDVKDILQPVLNI